MADQKPPESVILPDEHVQEWASSTYMVRACDTVLRELVDPSSTSFLAVADACYRWEKVSVWSRAYLRAAAESLSFWSNLVAPFEFSPEHVNHVEFRPYLLLGRASLEAAAHGLWLLSAKDVNECVERHVRLMHRDFLYHIQALESGLRDATRMQDRLSKLENRVADMSPRPNPKDKPPGYEKMIRLAAGNCGADENEWAYYWNAASGAAHGQNWFSVEAFLIAAKEEYEPGHFRVSSLPDPEFITATMVAATNALTVGTQLWLTNAGYSVQRIGASMLEVYERMPKKPQTG